MVSKSVKSNYKLRCREETRSYKNLDLTLQLVSIFIYKRDKPHERQKGQLSVRTTIVRDLIQFNLTLVIKVTTPGC